MKKALNYALWGVIAYVVAELVGFEAPLSIFFGLVFFVKAVFELNALRKNDAKVSRKNDAGFRVSSTEEYSEEYDDDDYREWHSDPASNRQKKCLRFFGEKIRRGMTKGDASKLIDKIFDNPEQRNIWRKYCQLTGDWGQESSQLQDFDPEDLSRVVLSDIARDGTSTLNAVRSTKECPFCAETILAKAILCKHCGKEQPKKSTQ